MLLIDIGNSRIKLGHSDGQDITELPPLAWRERDLVQVWTTLLGVLPPAPRVVVSNVGGAVVAERVVVVVVVVWMVREEGGGRRGGSGAGGRSWGDGLR